MKLTSKLASLLLLAFISFSSTKSIAQDADEDYNYPGGFFNITWQSAIPLGGLNDFLDKTTFNGINFEGVRFLEEHIAVGGEISSNYSYKRYDNATYSLDMDNVEGALNGIQHRSVKLVPILVKGYYYFMSKGTVKPYVALGAGLGYMKNELTIGMYHLEENNWGFSSSAEAGANIMFGNKGIQAGVKYNYSNINSVAIEKNDISRVVFNLGFSFLLEN